MSKISKMLQIANLTVSKSCLVGIRSDIRAYRAVRLAGVGLLPVGSSLPSVW